MKRPLHDPFPIGAEIKRAERFLSLAGELVRIETTAAEAERAAEAMQRATRSKRETGIQDLRDLGPPVRMLRGDTEMAERRTPDRALVRGARLYDPIANLLARGQITREQSDAAEKLRHDVEMCQGGFAAPVLDRVSYGSQTGGRWPPDDHLDALARVRAVIRELSAEHLEACEWVVLRRSSVEVFGLTVRRRRASASALLNDALTALAVHYGLQPR